MIKRIHCAALLFWAVAVCAATVAPAAQDGVYTCEFTSSKPSSIYAENEPIRLTARVLCDGKPAQGLQLRVGRVSADGRFTRSREVSSDVPVTFETACDRPGWVRLGILVVNENGGALKLGPKGRQRVVGGTIGAMIAPEKIRPGYPEPEDFDAFWKRQREVLNAVPVRADLTSVPAAGALSDQVACYDVKVDCAGGQPVSGYLAKPVNAAAKSLPAIVCFQGAGVYSAAKKKICNYAADGLLALEINAHGVPNGMPLKYYAERFRTDLKGYPRFFADDREKNYFLGMFFRVMRALDFIKAQPEWDGKTLIVVGNSQGGGQALAAAGLDGDVTMCVAGVAALCDHGGSLEMRACGWPHYYTAVKGKLAPKQKTLARNVAYYDCAYFAKRIKADTFMCTGFADITCAPTSVYAAYNSLPATIKKRLFTLPEGSHGMPNTHPSQTLAEYIASLKKR